MVDQLSRRELLIYGGALAATGLLGCRRALGESPSGLKLVEKHVIGAKDDFMIVRHLRIEGTDREIGQALARVAKRNHAAKFSPEDPKLVRARKEYFAVKYPALYERGKGAADELGIAWTDDSTDPFGLLYDGLVQPGCSTVYYPPNKTAGGHAYLSRNYDFTTRTLAEMFGRTPKPTDRAFTGDPYIIECRPDKGHTSLYLASYDLLTGCIDGINSAGLSVALLADDQAQNAKPSPAAQPGLGEIEVTRFLLDTCASCKEAKAALKEIEYYYTFIPCHYIIGDRHGSSFAWEHRIADNKAVVVEGRGQPQIVTNHLLSEHPDPRKRIEPFRAGSFSRYCVLEDEIRRRSGKLGPEDLKAINAEVQAGPHMLPQTESPDPKPGRTLWHSLYDLEKRSLEISFYLGEDAKQPKGQRRSDYLKFSLA